MTQEEFAQAAHEIAQRVADDLEERLLFIYNKLTESERDKFSQSSDGFNYAGRLARVALIADGPDRIEQQWNAEAIKSQVKSLKRILKGRYA